MTAVLDELRARLVADGVGSVGASTTTTSIFVDSLPDWPGVSIVLSLAVGSPGDRKYGQGVPGIERPRVEMFARSTAPAGGQVAHSTSVKAAATAAYRSLVSIANENIAASTSATPTFWLSVDSINGPPDLFDRDAQGRLYYRCSLQCDREST